MGLVIVHSLDLFHGERDWWATQAAVEDALWFSTAVNRRFFLEHPEAPGLYAPGPYRGYAFRYIPDPKKSSQERFQTAPYVIAEEGGDCDDLAPYHAAWLIAHGIYRMDEVSFVIFWKRAPDERAMNFHIQIETPDGVEDPSRALGMGHEFS